MRGKDTSRDSSREPFERPQRGKAHRKSIPRRTSPSERARFEKAQPEVRSRNPLVRLIDRIDWRIKIQITVGFCLAVIIATYMLREHIMALGNWGYLGAFIINAVSNASIILPAPGGVVTAIMAQDFNPLLIGLAAGLGGAIGGSTAYLAGVFNFGSNRDRRWWRWFVRVMGRVGGAIIFTFALIPILPADLASFVAGSVRYPFRKYLGYNILASMIKMTVIAYLGGDALVRLQNIILEWVSSIL